MILARNTLIPKQGQKSRHLAFRFLGFFGWDLKHSTRTSLSMPEMTHSSLLGKEILRDSQRVCQTGGDTEEGQIRPLSPWYSAWEEQQTRQLLICIQHGDWFQIPKEDQMDRGSKGVERAYPCEKRRAFDLKAVPLCRFCWPHKSSLQTRTILFFSGKTRDNSSLNVGVNSWMKIQGRSRSYLTAYSK